MVFDCMFRCHKRSYLFQVTLFEVHFSCCFNLRVSANLLEQGLRLILLMHSSLQDDAAAFILFFRPLCPTASVLPGISSQINCLCSNPRHRPTSEAAQTKISHGGWQKKDLVFPDASIGDVISVSGMGPRNLCASQAPPQEAGGETQLRQK